MFVVAVEFLLLMLLLLVLLETVFDSIGANCTAYSSDNGS